MVECHLAKVKVASSNLVSRSIRHPLLHVWGVFFVLVNNVPDNLFDSVKKSGSAVDRSKIYRVG